ncbi:hypothetical protein F2Q70_00045523 [Brassica cretica]|uniref:Uncharacterized protein n=1 Tax=Brassica cretica TaxID=69181 RepID=A0A8S9KMN9_BRACR|nr:hypothetical protein F2Q70_00045523 [Brassica cretica]
MEADQSSCNHRITESRLNSLSSDSLPSLYAPARFRRDQSDQVKTNEATHAEASKNVNVLYLLIATCFICILQVKVENRAWKVDVKVENRAWKVDVVKWSGALEWSIHGYWSGAFTSDRESLFHCLVSLSH